MVIDDLNDKTKAMAVAPKRAAAAALAFVKGQSPTMLLLLRLNLGFLQSGRKAILRDVRYIYHV